jgi:serine/threonine-protein kinase
MRYQLAGIQHIEFFEGQEDEAFKSMLVSLSRLGVSAEGAQAKPDSTSEIVLEGQSTVANAPVSTGRKGGIVTALLALAVIGLILALVLRPDKSIETPGKQIVEEDKSQATVVNPSKTSIAVLPFRNLGPQDKESLLADGMREEIDAMLSMTPSLTVKNASRMKDSELDPRAIGDALKVDSVLTGTVRQSGGQLRVIVQLVDTKTEENIWAKTFDKTESDIFAVQREIAQSVAEGLKLKLGEGQEDQLAKRQTKNLEAYNLFIQGRKMWNTRTREGMRDSIAKFELALAKDPNFALAHVGIADAYNQLVKYGHSPPKVSYPKAREELKKALELNENLAEVHASIGWIYLDFDWDWDAAEKSLRKAISIDPNNPEARRWISHLYMIQGKVSDAIYEIDKGIELVPNSANMLTSKSLCLVQSDIKSQIDLIMEGIRKDPAFVVSYADLAKKLAKTNEFEEALQVIADGEKLYPGIYEVEKAYVLASMGRKEEATNLLTEILSKKENEIVPLPFIADAYYKLGEMDLALAYFEEAIEEKHPDTPFLYIECDWFELFENTKFKELCGRMNLPPKTKE